MVGRLSEYAVVASIVALGFAAQAHAQDAAAAPKAAAQEEGADSKEDRLKRSKDKDADADSHTARPVKTNEPNHFRGQIVSVQDSVMTVTTRAGRTVQIALPEGVTVISLSKGSFASVDFGTYVGATGVKLDEYSPIVRDSAVWLHKGFELRIIDEDLRGIALGHKAWDLQRDCIISHGWVDDIEVRVLSIKWGPTDYDETDIEIPRDAPVLRMSLGDRSLIRQGAHVLAGAQKGRDGRYDAVFIFVGKDGIVPPL